MSTTSAERMRRQRAHRKGDHEQCLPVSCDAAPGAALAAVPEAVQVAQLTTEGQLFLADVRAADMPPVPRRLAVEFARSIDRLDRIHDLLTGEAHDWMRLDLDQFDGGVTVKITGVLAEARQQQMTMRSLAAELRAFMSEHQSEKPAAANPLAAVLAAVDAA